MASGLKEELELRLKINKNPSDIKNDLLEMGFNEDEVSDAIRRSGMNENSENSENSEDSEDSEGASTDRRNNSSLLTKKTVFDRIGYGFAGTQYINILFHMTGASFFIIGIFNAIKSALSAIFSTYLKQYSRKKNYI